MNVDLEPQIRVKKLRTLLLFIFLFLLWILWSGFYNSLLLSLGGLSCFLSVYLTVRMHALDEEGFSLKTGLRFLSYLPWLMRELIKSGIEISLCVINPKAKIAPRVVTIKPSQQTSIGLLIYANSITFTPGTVSTFVSNNKIEVHVITDSAEKDLINGAMNDKVKAIEENI